MKNLLYITLFICLGLFTNCSKKPKGDPGPNEIWLQYKAFNPGTKSVPVGTTITFTNKDNASHWVRANSGLFDSGKIITDNSYSFTFTTAGSYDFTCNYHSNVTSEHGTILVQ